MTETSPATFIAQRGSTNYASIGWPTSSTEAKVCKVGDETFKGLDVDELGELLVRSPSVMKGYLNNQEATDEAIISDGWLRTGDIASYDASGNFYLKDRLKELIKVKGFQVPPAELEEVLRDHPKILDAGVIGVEHSRYGEVPRAFVVKRDGVEITEKEIQDFVESKVADYKKLDGGVKFVEAIPKTTTGKILRRDLRKL